MFASGRTVVRNGKRNRTVGAAITIENATANLAATTTETTPRSTPTAAAVASPEERPLATNRTPLRRKAIPLTSRAARIVETTDTIRCNADPRTNQWRTGHRESPIVKRASQRGSAPLPLSMRSSSASGRGHLRHPSVTSPDDPGRLSLATSGAGGWSRAGGTARAGCRRAPTPRRPPPGSRRRRPSCGTQRGRTCRVRGPRAAARPGSGS